MENDIKIKTKTLHEPLSNYVSSAYNTLCSVTQGVALGALFYLLSISPLDITQLAKCFVITLLIGLLWHRYVINNQIVGWRLSPMDTIIPIVFAFLQFIVILKAKNDVLAWEFAFSLTIVSVWGAIAYHNAYRKTLDSDSKQLLFEHYHEESKKFKEDLYNEIVGFHIGERRSMLVVAFFTATLTLCAYYDPWFSEETHVYLVSVFSLGIIGWLFVRDARWKLNHSKSSLVLKYRW